MVAPLIPPHQARCLYQNWPANSKPPLGTLPRNGEVNHFPEYLIVHNSIIGLWGKMQNGQITNEEDFKCWVSQTKEFSVSGATPFARSS